MGVVILRDLMLSLTEKSGPLVLLPNASHSNTCNFTSARKCVEHWKNNFILFAFFYKCFLPDFFKLVIRKKKRCLQFVDRPAWTTPYWFRIGEFDFMSVETSWQARPDEGAAQICKLNHCHRSTGPSISRKTSWQKKTISKQAERSCY